MNRIELTIEERYPGQLERIKSIIERMKEDYDFSQFHEDDILEDILMRLDII